MTLSDFLSILAILLLLACSAFFSASEISFSSSNKIRIKKLAEENKKGARKALYILEHFDSALSTILVGSNFVNALSTTLCASLFLKFIFNPVLYNILNTVVMTVIILIFGEILPKSMCKSNPEKASLIIAPILFVVMKIGWIFCLPFNALQKLLKRTKKGEEKAPTVTEQELESIVETMEDEGVLDEKNADIIYGALKFNDVTVKDVMTPRVDVVGIKSSATISEVSQVFLEKQFSRIPVYSKNKDNIIGILNQKDFFAVVCGEKKLKIEEIMSPAIFVSTETKINEAMMLMQREKKHMVVVIDEYGGTSGVCTMEDCFEQVFGEVYDEHDNNKDLEIYEINNNEYKINAEIMVKDVFDYLHIETLPEEKYSPLSSFLCGIDEKVPEQGDVIKYQTIDEIFRKDRFIKRRILLEFTLSKVENKRIKEVTLLLSYLNSKNEKINVVTEEKKDESLKLEGINEETSSLKPKKNGKK